MYIKTELVCDNSFEYFINQTLNKLKTDMNNV